MVLEAQLSQSFQLPYDILLRIFTFYIKRLLTSGSSERTKPSEWLSFTHVCQYWRSAALESPTLWTEPDFRFPSIAHETLKRSQSLPISLTIRASEGAKLKELAIEMLKSEYFPRIAYLELCFSSPSALEAVLRVAVSPASSLHTLRLEGGYYAGMVRVLLPDNFLGGTSVGLRQLEMVGFSIPWNSTFLRDLTHFDVKLPSPDLSVSQLCRILRRCPALESLKLWNCLFTTGEDVAPVELPRICDLFLGASILVSIELLSILKVPPSAVVRLSWEESEPSPADIDYLLRPLLVSSKIGKPTRDLMGLSFAWEVVEGFQFLTCLVFDEIPTLGNPSREFFALTFHFRTFPPPNLGPYVHTFLEGAPISALRFLHFGNLSILPLTARLVSTLPQLYNLDLDSTVQTCALLTQAFGIQAEDGIAQRPYPFPSLSTLRFYDVAFGSRPPASELELRSLLIQHLSSRRAHGAAIETLVLVSCKGFSEEDIRELKVHVGEVLEKKEP
ncbi:hypothetical protein V5O48_014503 [Marasmius crinis-equi]|uniref:F-box domain-containing protein n=1 Tax=Marasmius crinis-equi TaxID=585013 RepID=A0ABR3EX46_9AGAR